MSVSLLCILLVLESDIRLVLNFGLHYFQLPFIWQMSPLTSKQGHIKFCTSFFGIPLLSLSPYPQIFTFSHFIPFMSFRMYTVLILNACYLCFLCYMRKKCLPSAILEKKKN